MWWIIPALILPMTSHGRMDCSKSEYERCVKIADPLVKEAHLVFPDNMDDIDQVCRTWNKFVDCLKIYTDECFTDQQRKQFNRAVESPIESVHQMCMQPSYQREYLQYAPCIKSTIVERNHCGPQYNLLVDQVDQGDIISKSTLCCSHDRFKQCVQRETRRLCDRGNADGPATRFATQIIDKALSFLQDQCFNYIPNSGDCSTLTTDTLPYADRSDPMLISTSSSEVYPWSTIQQDVAGPKELPSRVTPPKAPTTSWSPLPNVVNAGNSPTSDTSSTQMLGSRTRPASYGRSNSWAEKNNNPQVAGNTVQMYPDLPSTPSTRADWATPVWDVNAQAPGLSPGIGTTKHADRSFTNAASFVPSETSSEVWYPVAGTQLNNEVDEPNQLGLKKSRNAAMTNTKSIFLAVFATVVFLF